MERKKITITKIRSHLLFILREWFTRKLKYTPNYQRKYIELARIILWIFPVYFLKYYRSTLSYPKKKNYKNIIHYKSYITCIPNPREGIGAQITRWNSALILSQQFGLQFVHYPFIDNHLGTGYDNFLKFGKDEMNFKQIVKNQSISQVYLPRIDLRWNRRIQMIFLIVVIKIIFRKFNALFILHRDTAVPEQSLTTKILREKYWNARKKSPVDIQIDLSKINISIHVRRPIIDEKVNITPVMRERWLENSYFINILKTICKVLNGKKFEIHIYSVGKRDDYKVFYNIPNVRFHLNEDIFKTFHGMVVADILVLSPGSFSYYPGMISKNLKIAKKESGFLSIPNNGEWITCDESGNFDNEFLIKKYGM